MTNEEKWRKALRGKYKVEVVKMIRDRNLNNKQEEVIWGLWREVNKSIREQALDPMWWIADPLSETDNVNTGDLFSAR